MASTAIKASDNLFRCNIASAHDSLALVSRLLWFHTGIRDLLSTVLESGKKWQNQFDAIESKLNLKINRHGRQVFSLNADDVLLHTYGSNSESRSEFYKILG